MKHRKGIDLGERETPSYSGDVVDRFFKLGGLMEWETIGARCGACEHETWLDRWELQRKYGTDLVLYSIVPKFRCRRCGNRQGNRIFLGKLPR